MQNLFVFMIHKSHKKKDSWAEETTPPSAPDKLGSVGSCIIDGRESTSKKHLAVENSFSWLEIHSFSSGIHAVISFCVGITCSSQLNLISMENAVPNVVLDAPAVLHPEDELLYSLKQHL